MPPPISLGIGLGLSRASRPFSPLDLSPALWMRPDLGLTAPANAVNAWADQSGNGRHFVQGTSGAQPIYSATGGPNGTPCVTLGGARYMTSTTAASAWSWLHDGALALWIVARQTIDAAADVTALLATSATAASKGAIYSADDRPASSITDRVGVGILDGSGGSPVPYATSSNGALPYNSWRVIEWVMAPTSAAIVSVSGSVVLLSAGAWTPPSGAPGYTAQLGRSPPAYVFGAAHDIADVIGLARTPTASDLAQVRRYITARYGVTA